MLPEVRHEPAVRDVPQLDGAVLRTARHDVVVEGVPLDVEHGAAVAADLKKKDNVFNMNF